MHVTDREPSPLEEERREDHRVRSAEDGLRHVDFEREVAPEGGVAAEDDVDPLIRGGPRGLEHVLADGPDEGLCFAGGEGAGVGQDEEPS